MVKLVEKKSLIKIGKEPVVILSLKKWKKIIEYMEDLEDRERYFKAIIENQEKKGITLEQLKKKYNL